MRIRGESGWPFLVSGKFYAASSLARVRKGDFVVFRNPRNSSEQYVKRVAAIENGRYALESTVSWGASSHDFGTIGEKDILGKLLFI